MPCPKDRLEPDGGCAPAGQSPTDDGGAGTAQGSDAPLATWSCPAEPYVTSTAVGLCINPSTGDTVAAIASCGGAVHWSYDTVTGQCVAVSELSCPSGGQDMDQFITRNVASRRSGASCFSGP